ncbi:MAG: hypothetical protein JO244_04540, partial [Solirubrobacterales bacterium]|nr:hypothetical protein [Solirubrobacterales bacterium]
MRKLIRWSLLIAAVVTATYFLTAGAETRSTRASVPRQTDPPVVSNVPVVSDAPNLEVAASRGVQELIRG